MTNTPLWVALIQALWYIPPSTGDRRLGYTTQSAGHGIVTADFYEQGGIP